MSRLEYLFVSNLDSTSLLYCPLDSDRLVYRFYFIGNHNNLKYFDLSFSAASTQTGLSTIIIKKLTFFGKSFYVSCTFVTPIFIHASLVFIRYKK